MTQVSIMLVRALVVAVERVGVERARVLEEAGLGGEQLEDIHARMPLASYRRAVHAAYRLSGDPAFGLHMGERLTMGSFDVIGHLIEHSDNLRDALMVAVRYSRIVTAGPRVTLEEDADAVMMRLDLPNDGEVESVLAAEFSLVALLRMVRSFVGEDALPQHALFAHGAPAHRAEYTRYFGGRERFSQACTGLQLDRNWLERVPSCREKELWGYLQRRAELLLARADRDVSAAERVRRWLEEQTDLCRPTLTLAARGLGTSTRTLRRRLHAEHVQFSALLDERRAAQAKGMLLDSTRSIQDTAYALGFRTPSAFSRAFKRWTGMPPKDYRPSR